MQELTADAHWIGTCHPCDDNHMHFGVYLIEASKGYVLVDAGSQYFYDEIVSEVESVTGLDGVDTILLTHSTLPHTDNVDAFRDEWGDVEVISASSVPETMGLTSVDVWEIGGSETVCGREFEFIEPPLTDIAFSLWIYDTKSEILFTAEAPGNLHVEGECERVYDGHALDLPYERIEEFYRERLPWLAYGVPDQIDPWTVVSDKSVSFLAPIHGNPVEGALLGPYRDLVRRAITDIAAESDPRAL